MKKLIKKIYNVKTHAKHAEIKGRKSGGVRDNNGNDWLERKGTSTTTTNPN
jgi:hypothetical protein